MCSVYSLADSSSLFVGCWLLVVVCYFACVFVRRSLFVVCCLFFFNCLLFVVHCLLFVVEFVG